MFARLLFAISGKNPCCVEHFETCFRLQNLDSTVCAVKDLSHLQLALLLSCFEFTALHNLDSFNFWMVQEFYKNSIGTKSLKFGDRPLLRAFKEIEECGLLTPFSRSSDQPEEFRQLVLNISRQQLQTAVLQMRLDIIPTDLQQLCSKYR